MQFPTDDLGNGIAAVKTAAPHPSFHDTRDLEYQEYGITRTEDAFTLNIDKFLE